MSDRYRSITSPTGRSEWGFMPFLVVGFALLHLLVLMLDLQRPDAFLRADRAIERLHAIEALGSSTGWQELFAFIGTHGILGDYVVHAALYLPGGRVAVIVFQSVLLLLSSVGVFRLARMATLTPAASSIAAGLYLVLPHSLVFPHQLITEGIYVPLVVISMWMLCAALRRRDYRLLALAGLLLGLCTLVRPITLLWPAVVFVLIGALHRWRAGALFATMAYLPIFLWMSVVNAYTGSYGLGESGHTMGRNLYLRVTAIAATLPEEERARVKQQYLDTNAHGRLSPVNYLAFGAQHPGPFVKHMARDAVVFLAKSGIERITVDYFASDRQFKTLTHSNEGWRTRFDRDGPVATVGYLWKTLGWVFALSLLGSALLVMLMALAITGAIFVLKELRARTLEIPEKITVTLLVAFPIYIFVFSTVVNAMQSRQRAPAEFALAILAAYALRRLIIGPRALAARPAPHPPFSPQRSR